eukprot:TRINITY_DN4654_c0_g1_i1.p1 TRINITY_DN4654_c0_g1~~TRINITY_DN4654_c0_g1_i1.p1  ORF type:complete len:613 (+),score=244.97 TRINITY_DN4654_c0_g1_i1:120-1958(+)
MGCCFSTDDGAQETGSKPLLQNQAATPHQAAGHEERLAVKELQLFQRIDKNANGRITIDELRDALESDPAVQVALGWPKTLYQDLFDLLDPSRKTYVDRKSLGHYIKVHWLFKKLDTSGNGVISVWELENGLRSSPEVKKELGVPYRLAPSLFQQIDTDGNGAITLVEFYRYYTHAALSEEYQYPKDYNEMAVRLLKKMDADRSGTISPSELAAALRQDRSVQLELSWPAHLANELFMMLDPDQKNVVTLDALRRFCRIRWLFNIIDQNRSGFIDNFEFGLALQHPHMQRELGTRLHDAQKVFAELDVERNNDVSFLSFYRYFLKKPPLQNAPSAAPAPIVPEKPGDKYSVKKKFAEGAFGSVFLVERKTDGLQLIMKRPKLESGVTMEEIQQEAEMMKRLKHPHIVRLIESYQEHGVLILIVEFAAGGDLRTVQKGRPFPESKATRIFEESIDGLKFIHSRHILHRDLKPDNIFLTDGGSVKIGDMGLATSTEKQQHGFAYTQCGTPVYMAPEVMEGKKYNSKADMFSMGCILYELATGKLCFTNPAAIIKNQLPTDIPQWCASLVDVLLRQDPEARFSADQTLDSLRRKGRTPVGAPPIRNGAPNFRRHA